MEIFLRVALGIVLAIGMTASALLILRVDDQLEANALRASSLEPAASSMASNAAASE